jgi:hypothetical protein
LPRSDVTELTQRLIGLAFAADALLGKGTVVDFYFGDEDVQPPDLNAVELSRELDALADEAQGAWNASTGAVMFTDLVDSARGLARFVEAKTGQFSGDYEDAVKTILGCPLARRSDKELAALRASLLIALGDCGYEGGWPGAVTRWQDDASIEADAYLAAIQDQADRLRPLAHAHVLVPILGRAGANTIADAVSVEFELVDTEATWAAYHAYDGQFKSRIQINRRRIFNRDEAAVFASHEVYPGHHTHATIREHFYRQGEVGLEASIALFHTPGSLIDEGIGEYARNFLPEQPVTRERAAYLHDRLITETRHGIALDLNADRLREDEAVAALMEEAAVSDERATRALEFASEWRYYFPAYLLGYDLVKRLYTAHGERSLRALYTRKSGTAVEQALTLA